MSRAPAGISFLTRRSSSEWSVDTHRYIVLALTFIACVTYNASRKPTIIVKSVLDSEALKGLTSSSPWLMNNWFLRQNLTSLLPQEWAPFNGHDGIVKLTALDHAFLLCYTLGLFMTGCVGDKLHLRHVLTVGMIGSGIFVGLFGMGYFWNIHSFTFYLVMQMMAGLFEGTGWPSVISVVGNWFGKNKRGLIMGIWNAHSSIGNIVGSLLAASVLDSGWGWSFILPGALIIAGGIMIHFFLVAYPEDVGISLPRDPRPNEQVPVVDEPVEVEPGRSDQEDENSRGNAVGLLQASAIPGVKPYAFILLFSKMVGYTFAFWLPFNLSQIVIDGEQMSIKSAGNVSTVFDVGGIVGGILAGFLSDVLGNRAMVAAFFALLSSVVIWVYHKFGCSSAFLNIFLLSIAGICVNAPYALITTAVCADLGTHDSLRGNSRALAAVTAIIDGTGSLGFVFWPLLTGLLSRIGWNNVYVVLVFVSAISMLLFIVIGL